MSPPRNLLGSTARPWRPVPLLGVLLCPTLAACDPQESDAKEPTAEQGTPLQMASPFAEAPGTRKSAEGSLHQDADFTLQVKRPKLCGSTAPFVPMKGYERLSLPITVRATAERTIPLTPLAFRMVDGDGHLYGATLAGCEPPLPSQALPPGQEVSGAIAFDVPSGTEQLELQFEPILIGRPAIHARVSVPPLP